MYRFEKLEIQEPSGTKQSSSSILNFVVKYESSSWNLNYFTQLFEEEEALSNFRIMLNYLTVEYRFDVPDQNMCEKSPAL